MHRKHLVRTILVCLACLLSLPLALDAAPQNPPFTAPPPVVRDGEGNPCKGKGLGHVKNAGNPGHDGQHAKDECENEPPPPPLPPDPATIAPPYTDATHFDLYAASEFLWTHVPPVQTEVTAGAILPYRIALLRGRVLDRTGASLSGVKVAVHDEPETGSTLSRADGVWDLAVNGGRRVTLRYEKQNFLVAFRSIEVASNDWGDLPDVVLIPLDPAISNVTSNATEMQVARGSISTDDDGVRQATLLFPGGTTATMRLPDGTSQPLAAMTVRATEYTVGANGPLAMPAELPENTGYTYAVELSIDQAMTAQAESVEFSQPVVVYVENFLGFPVGEPVPNGFFDRKRAVWVPERNGRIVRILSVTGGLADLDVEGAGVAANAAELAELGISAAERGRVAVLYAVGQSLWRVPTDHFSPADFNWPYGPPDDAEPPPPIEPEPANPNDPVPPDLGDDDQNRDPDEESDCEKGSIIDCGNRTLRESISLTGAPYSLNYSSERIPKTPQNVHYRVALTGATYPATLKRVDFSASFQGRTGRGSFAPAPNLSTTIGWDQADRFARSYLADSIYRLEICYVYNAVSFSARSAFESALSRFPSGSGTTLSTSRDVAEFNVCRRLAIPLGRLLAPTLGGWDPSSSGLGAWTLDAHHRYNPSTGVLYLGDGRKRMVRPFDQAVYRIAGTGVSGFSGDGGPARNARVGFVSDIAFGADGSIFLADSSNRRVRKIDLEGVITTVAGNGTRCLALGCGDGLPATQAPVEWPQSLVVDPDGSLVIGDAAGCIRRVDPAGVISTLYGDCFQGPNRVSSPSDLLRGPGGGLYIADSDWYQILYLGTDGLLSEVAGDQSCGVSISGVPALSSPICEPGGLDFDADGNLLVAGGYANQVLRISKDGLIDVVAGRFGVNGPVGDGGPANAAQLNAVFGVAARPDGSYLIADTFNGRLRRVSPHGTIETIAGDPQNGLDLADGMHPERLYVGYMEKVAVGPDRKIHVSDTWDSRVLAIGDAGPIVKDDEFWIPSQDGGTVDVFDRIGRHLRTMHSLTGATLLSFGYDADGRLLTLTNVDGNVTTVERDLLGAATAIVGPYGQRNAVAIDSFGRLTAVSNPANEATTIAYAGASLFVSTLTNPRSFSNSFTYDPSGRIGIDTDPVGGFKVITGGADGRGSSRVSVRTAEGRRTNYERRIDTETETRWTRQFVEPGDEVVTRKVHERDGSRTVHQPNGAVSTSREFTDPVWGGLVRFPDRTDVSTPAGFGPTVETSATATLANPQDPLSVTTRTTQIKVNNKIYRAQFDKSLMEWTFTSPAGRVSKLGIDEAGRPTYSQLGNLAPTFFDYDARGKLTSIVRGTGVDERRIAFTYDSTGRLDTATDPLLRSVAFDYDLANRVIAQHLPGGRTVAFDWDENGNLTSLTPPGKPAHLFSYTPVDLAASYEPPAVPGGGSTLYNWNLDKNPESVVRPDGEVVSFGYDAAQRPTSITSDRGTQTIEWEPNTGRVDKMTTPEGVVLDYTWDGPLVKRTQWSGAGISGSVERTYDDDLRLKTISVNGANPITYNYDQDSLITQAGAMTLTRDPATGLLTGTALGNVTTAYTYNQFGELATMTARFGATVLYAEVYTRDTLGRIVHRVETIQGVTTTYGYAYDSAGRLWTVSRNGAETARYEYDLNGNRLAKITPVGTEVGSYDGQDRVVSYAGSDYGFFESGEVAAKTNSAGTATFAYTATGEPISGSHEDGTIVEFISDARGRRIESRINGVVTNRFLWQNQIAPIVELSAANAVASRFVYATRSNVPDVLVKGGSAFRVVHDHLGSPRLLVNSTSGLVLRRQDFDEFGRVVLDSAPSLHPFGFGGSLESPVSSLSRFGFRDYDSARGSWTSRDPLGFVAGVSNLYEFATGDPINVADPWGFAPFKNSSKIPIPYKGEGDEYKAPSLAQPGETVDADGIYSPEGAESPICLKIPNNCSAETDESGNTSVECDLRWLDPFGRGRPREVTPEDLRSEEFLNWPDPYAGRNWPYPLWPRP